jgi:endonuclease-3
MVRRRLEQVISQLRSRYGAPRAPLINDPFQLLLLESVAYLVSDERREEAFKLLRKKVGTKPHEILGASSEELLRVTQLGGMAPELRANRLREIALIAMDEFGGDLKPALKLPLAKARQAFRKFPGIGEPGADKILLFTGSYPVLSLDSNALRVLLRLGFSEEKRSYTATYRAVQKAINSELKEDFDWLICAYLLLRQHGKETCKTSKPRCEKCPVRSQCIYFAKSIARKDPDGHGHSSPPLRSSP